MIHCAVLHALKLQKWNYMLLMQFFKMQWHMWDSVPQMLETVVYSFSWLCHVIYLFSILTDCLELLLSQTKLVWHSYVYAPERLHAERGTTRSGAGPSPPSLDDTRQLFRVAAALALLPAEDRCPRSSKLSKPWYSQNETGANVVTVKRGFNLNFLDNQRIL